MSQKDFTIVDRRGKEEIDDPRNVAPASIKEEIEDIKLKPGENFVHPCGARVLIQEDSALNKVGRIILPDKTKRRPTTGTILEVGPECGKFEYEDILVEDPTTHDTHHEERKTWVPSFKVGQKIIFGLYSGTVLTYKGWDPKTKINFRVLGVDEILGWQDEEAPELEGVGT